MALVPMKNLLENAESKNIAVGAFGVGNMEMVMGAVAAAEEMNTPVILSIKNSPSEILLALLLSAAKNSKVQIALHLDGVTKLETAEKAFSTGFTSVMFDGSSFSLAENIQAVKQIRALADTYGASVEAKLPFTSPDDAKLFCDETGIDALAVSIENEAGQLRLDVLDDINKMVETHLVLKTWDCVATEMLQQSVMLGIRKINVDAECFMSLAKGASEYCKARETADFSELSRAMAESVYLTVKRYIKIFNMQSEI